MSDERENLLFLIQILDQTDRAQDMVKSIKRVIELNPQLTMEEFNLLSCSYKKQLDIYRNDLQTLDAVSQHEDGQLTPERIGKIAQIREEIAQKLISICTEVIDLFDKVLEPIATEPETRVFCLKTKADYYRYMCETQGGDEKMESANNAHKYYEASMELAKSEIKPYCTDYLSIILNYSVFLFNIMGYQQEALDLAKKTYMESSSIVEENSDDSYSSATMILQIFRDNIKNWTDLIQNQNE